MKTKHNKRIILKDEIFPVLNFIEFLFEIIRNGKATTSIVFNEKEDE